MDSKSLRWRWVARLSIIAALGCMSANCLSNQLLTQLSLPAADAEAMTKRSLSASGQRVSQFASIISSLMLIGGIVLGSLGIWAGRRRREVETALIAALGLCMNLAIAGLAAWFLWSLMSLKEVAPTLDS